MACQAADDDPSNSMVRDRVLVESVDANPGGTAYYFAAYVSDLFVSTPGPDPSPLGPASSPAGFTDPAVIPPC